MGAPATAQQTAVAMVALTWLSMILRFYINGVMIRKVNADDWAMLATTMVFTVYCGILFKLIVYLTATFGTIPNLLLVPITVKYMFIVSNLFLASTIVLKISFTLFLLRFVIVRWQRLTLYASTTLFLFCGTAYLASILMSCGNPLHYYANRLADRCFNRDKVTIPTAYAYCVINALTDCTFSIIAVFWARGMTFAKVEGRVVKGILVVGLLSMFCSFIPLYYIHYLKAELTEIIAKLYILATLSMLKIGGSIVATSLEALEPLFFKPEVKDDTSRISTSSAGTSSSASSWEKDFEKGPQSTVFETSKAKQIPEVVVTDIPEASRRRRYSQHRLTQSKLAERCEYRRSVYNANHVSTLHRLSQHRNTRWSIFFDDPDALPPVPPAKTFARDERYLQTHQSRQPRSPHPLRQTQSPVFCHPPMPAPGHGRWI